MIGKRTILLVDDEESILFSLQRILELSGEFEVVMASSARAALKIIQDQIPDLIISDIMMPGMDGIEFCRKIRKGELTRNTPFMFLTAKKDYMIEGFKAGGDDFIMKPFSVDEVIAKIEALFRRVKSTAEQAGQVKGKLGDEGLAHLIKLAHEKSISGEITLQLGNKVGKILLKAGDISDVSYKHQRDDEALDTLMGWQGALFVIKPSEMEVQQDFWQEDGQEPGSLEEPVEIAENIWWTGQREGGVALPGNPFLRRFEGNEKSINFLINPGSPLDFPVISKKLAAVIKNISNIHLYSLGQPHPDICGNAYFIRSANNRAICVTSEENWQIASHYEINSKSVKLTSSFKDGIVTLATGHKIKFIATPYCRSAGAYMVYDLQSRILFSGDLLSGYVGEGKPSQLYATEDDWDGVRSFHQRYIPSGAALRNALNEIKGLNPAPLVIAPQYGFLLRGELKDIFMERLNYLEVGADLLKQEYSQEMAEKYTEAANELIKVCADQLELARMIEKISANPRVMPRCEIKKHKITAIFSRPDQVFEQIALSIIDGEKSAISNFVKSQALKICKSLGLHSPRLAWDADQTLTGIPKQIFSE